jgi:DNA-binding transcriptional LysR family regulator
MDVRQLRHFVAVADTLHFGRAAELLRMTQPPLSQSILALEREIGSALFVRTKRRVALTAFGAQWLALVRPAIAQIDDLPERAQQLREGQAGQLSLSFVSTADYNLLPLLVRAFTARFPTVELRLTEATSDQQVPALLEQHCHAGIIIPPATKLPRELRYARLLTEPLVAAVPEAWLGEGRIGLTDGRMTADAVSRLPMVLFPEAIAPAFHALVTDYVAGHGGRVNVIQQAIQMQTIVSLVSAGLGIALVPASLRNLARAGVRYVDLQDAPMLETGIVWRRDDDTPTLRHFLDLALSLSETERLPKGL